MAPIHTHQYRAKYDAALKGGRGDTITLRDEIATAVVGEVFVHMAGLEDGPTASATLLAKSAARVAYQIADEMILARDGR